MTLAAVAGPWHTAPHDHAPTATEAPRQTNWGWAVPHQRLWDI
jgi:hypothetical protein